MGNTNNCNPLAVELKDHPHSHGEYSPDTVSLLTPVGITPTRMGNTICDLLHHGTAWGSPPLAWGIQILGDILLHRFRITPTRMGNTGLWSLHPSPAWGSPPLAWGIPLISTSQHLILGITPTRMGNTLFDHSSLL